MNWEYYILHIDDDETSITTLHDLMKTYFQDLGFNLIVNKNVDAEVVELDTDQYFNNNEVDLILVDFNLDRGHKGSEIIEKIRKNQIFTEIIFYSVDPNYKTKIKDEFEGVYYSSRDDLDKKIPDVVKATLNKILSLDYQRGYFIASSIYISELMDEIILKIMEIKDDKKDIFRNEIMNGEFFYDRAKHEIINNFLKEYGTYINSCRPKGSRLKGDDLIKFNEEFLKYNNMFTLFSAIAGEIIPIRNKLAHSKKDPDNIHQIISKSGTICLSEEGCAELRKKYMKHIKNMEEIIENFDSILNIKQNKIFLPLACLTDPVKSNSTKITSGAKPESGSRASPSSR